MNQNFQERKAIENLIKSYIEATYDADIEGLKAIFHPQAFMCGFLGDNFIAGTTEPFLQDVGSKPSMKSNNDPYEGIIKSIRMNGKIAQVVLLVDGFYGDTSIEDYLSLVKDEDNNWRIIAKTFTTIS